MTGAFDHLDLRDLVGLLSREEQQDLRPVVLRLVSNHAWPIEQTRPAEAITTRRRLSFVGTVHAGPDFASTSHEVLSRELGGHE